MANYVGRELHSFIFAIIVSLLMTFVKQSSSRKLVVQEHRQPYLIDGGGYYLLDKDNLLEYLDATK